MSKHLRNVRVLNLLFSGVVLLIGLIIDWLLEPAVFQTDFVLYGFEFWLIQWLMWIVTYGLLQSRDLDSRFALATTDLHTALALGLCVVLAECNALDGRRLLINLILVFGLLTSWNFVVGTWALSLPLKRRAQTLWLLPSMAASLASFVGLAVFSMQRYQFRALFFAIVCVGYAFLQMPSYSIVFRKSAERAVDDWCLTCLAFGKLLLGGAFYSFYLTVPVNEQALHWSPRLGSLISRGPIAKIAGTVFSALVALILKFLGNLLLDQVRRRLHPRRNIKAAGSPA